jgi:hypothetical protein
MQFLERETGVEPATSTLARSRSTTELLPLDSADYKRAVIKRQTNWHEPIQSACKSRGAHCGSSCSGTMWPSRM